MNENLNEEEMRETIRYHMRRIVSFEQRICEHQMAIDELKVKLEMFPSEEANLIKRIANAKN